MKSSLGFIECGCPRSNLLCSPLSQFTLLYNLVPDNIQWCIKYPRGWSVRSARGWSVRSTRGWSVRSAKGWSVRSARGWK